MTHLAASLEETILKVFSQGGILSKHLEKYELRQEQVKMALTLLEAYEDSKIALVEAATGVGKSWAYLVPALLFAVQSGEPTVISTHTIALQEQLIEKDIPFLLDLLGLDLQATLVKGMGNYFCWKKWDEVQEERLLLDEVEQRDLFQLEAFAAKTKEGSLSSLKIPLAPGSWEKVAAERSSCTHVECPHFKKCFFFKARRQLSSAKILVVNHHLLFADLLARMRDDFQEEKGILPPFSRIVFDEAHHLEEIALESFSARVDRLELIRLLGRIYSDLQPQKSRIGQIKQEVIGTLKQIPASVQNLLDIDIPEKKRKVLESLEALVEEVQVFCECFVQKEVGESRWMLSEEAFAHTSWEEDVKEAFASFRSSTTGLFTVLSSLKQELKSLAEEKDTFSASFSFLEAVEKIFTEKLEQISIFIHDPFEEKRVRWVEKNRRNLTFVDARLQVAEHLKQHLFDEKETAILCSATLTSGKNFTFFKKQIGLTESKRVLEKAYPSPFDLQKNARLCIPASFPMPHEPSFLSRSHALLEQIISAAKGGCFLLFTSYDMLERCYSALEERLAGFTCLKQGQAGKGELIERFKADGHAVLFATASFWEGIDVPGEALRCVVLMKLPFKVPSDPLFKATSQMYEREGKDPFKEYSLPLAALRFTQGFGRLIRTKEDRGCVVCLDSRIKEKFYGKFFLKSLPEVPIIYEEETKLIEEMEKFYQGNGA